MSQFVPIHPTELQNIIEAGRQLPTPAMTRIPPEYFSKVLPIRIVFWQRLRLLHKLIRRHASRTGSCLDFGGGGGVFAPTLANTFDEVALLDLDTSEAGVVAERFKLNNVHLHQEDATQCDLGEGRFDVIVAADVLEHFYDVDSAITPIHRWLADDGLLVTSLPTETATYEFLRLIFRTEKPEDHYHKAYEVENRLEERGFQRVQRLYAPLPLPLFPLFYISAWRKKT